MTTRDPVERRRYGRTEVTQRRKFRARDSKYTEKYRDKDEVNKAKIEKTQQQYDAKHFTEECCSQDRSTQEPLQLCSNGNQITANIDSTEAVIENKATEVESISSESSRSSLRSHFFPKDISKNCRQEIDTRNMNSGVTSFTRKSM